MSDLSKLIRKRGVLKRRVTDFDKIVNDAELAFPTNAMLPRADTINLETRLEKIQTLIGEYEIVQEEIDELNLATNADYSSNDLQLFENSIYAAITRCRCFLEAKASLASPLQAPTPPPVQQGLGNNVIADISLPQIALPKFNGALTKWLEFRDTFEAVIHKSVKLSEIQKLYYLRASLSGEAAQIISSLETCAANYATAWSLLCERYENKRVLIQNHVKALFNIQAIKKESSTQLHEMLDVITVNLRALKGLGQPVEAWDTMLIVSVISKIDETTAREWEAHTRSQRDFPTLKEFKLFIQEKATMLDNLKGCKEEVVPIKHGSEKHKHNDRALVATGLSCYYCKANHTVYNCTTFLQLSIDERLKEVSKLNLCEICMRPGHEAQQCKASGCRKCKGKHNTLLHKEQQTVGLTAKAELPCLLPTALVNAVNGEGRVCSVLRALLDTGSQSNFMSQETAKHLKLPIEALNVRVCGVNNNETNILGRCKLKIQSRYLPFEQGVSFLVLPTITSELPQTEVDENKLGVPTNVELADPRFSKPGTIDILLGAGLFFDVLMSDKLNLGRGRPIMLKTRLGWVFAGGPERAIGNIATTKCNLNKTSETNDIQAQLAKFWQLEECNLGHSEAEHFCEEHFKDTVERNSEGRFVVSLPFIKPITLLGDSRESAIKRFLSYERKLNSNPKLREPYVEFMREYQSLNHMTEIDIVKSSDIEYVLPHHGVVNEASKTTKLRVVFDASNTSSTGHSLNSLQAVGPQIQQELFSILVRFRQHPIAISADVTKMYRQILVNYNDRKFQKIVWRENPSEPLKLYQLNTVTYGEAAAPFLAVRCLQQLALDASTSHPQASQIIRDDFYVDDLLSGGEDVEEVLKLAQEISTILNRGHFPLRKWISNSPEVMQALECTERLSCLNLGENEITKTLGLYWETVGDNFVFSISKALSSTVTKRTILSMTGQIFDPLGLLGACTITAKLLLQKLWHEGKGWDDQLSPTLESEWQTFRHELLRLNNLKIPRYMLGSGRGNLQLHGFADASERAYGACVYIVTADKSANLIASKSRVAPLKTQTIPRLELCAALLLSHLVSKILTALRISLSEVYLWSDSTIVLSWLQMPRGHFKIFVSNRVGQIQDLTENANWRYIPSKQNPADLVSRGISAQKLLHCNLWWHGPAFLVEDQSSWPNNITSQLDKCQQSTVECRTKTQIFVAVTSINCELIERFSNLNRAKRVFAYCNRFLSNSRSTQRNVGPLSADELECALKSMTKLTQRSCYSDEIKALRNKSAIKNDSKILALSPFLDKDGILRVGGRLQFSNLREEQKHAIILPPKSHLSLLIFRAEHLRLGHAGPLQLLSSVRDHFWPVHGRNMAKRVVGNCVGCYRAKPTNKIPIMGSLPKERVIQSSPFLITGIDYAGPFMVKRHKGRGAKLEKAYLAIFVCFCIKAVHIEVVLDLSSDAFLASLKRFIARRGKPREIYSDNGTNFVGASKELDAIITMLRKNSDYIFSDLANEGIK